jgi:hypothetical protein
MLLLSWVALLGGGVFAGLGPVAAMTWPRGREPFAVAGAVAAGLTSAAGLVGIAILGGRAGVAVAAGFLGVASGLCGFALGGAVLAQLGAEPALALLPDPLPPPTSRLGVILLSSAEPEEYRPSHVARELQQLADAGVQLPPEPMRPFIFASEKARFRFCEHLGARDSVSATARRLSGLLGAVGATVVPAWTDDHPFADEALATLCGTGVRRVVVAELTCARDAPFTRAKGRLSAVRTKEAGVEVVDAGTLWSSQALAERVAARIIEAAGSASRRPLAGVALLGAGQAPEFDDVDPDRAEQETYFHQRVRALLVEAGFDAEHVRPAWVEWHDPGVTEVVRHLAALGCSRIVVAPASIPVETRSTLLDVREYVEHARVDAAVEVFVLPAWNDDPVVAQELADAVRRALTELG